MHPIVLVKHGPPKIDPAVPASDWELATEGAAPVQQLARRLLSVGVDRVVSSLEPKAAATGQQIAQALGCPARTAAGLEEHHRASTPFFPTPRAFRAAVIDALRHPDELRLGEETVNSAQRRFAHALAAARVDHPTDTLCVVAHGTVIAAFTARLCNLDAVALWESLALPSALVLDLDASGLVDQF